MAQDRPVFSCHLLPDIHLAFYYVFLNIGDNLLPGENKHFLVSREHCPPLLCPSVKTVVIDLYQPEQHEASQAKERAP